MTDEPIRLVVPPEAEGLRLDRFLAERFPDRTRSALRRLVDGGLVVLDGAPARKPGVALRPGMRLEVSLPPPPTDTLQPESIPLTAVFEDDAMIVVDKPAGIVVHPGHGRRSGTIVNALLGRGTPLAPAGGKDRPGIVHRLDRETSGLLVVAKTDSAHRALARAFAQRAVRKTYVALVWGRPAPPDGTIERPIGRSRADRTKMAVGARRSRAATTVYRTIEPCGVASWLEIDLVTGRTHQIRVHMASAGHPVLGDTRYGGAPWRRARDPNVRAATKAFHRLALHARDLGLAHPVTGKAMRVHAPVPAELRDLLDVCRGATP